MKIDFGRLVSDNSADTVLSPREIFGVLPQKDERYQYPRDVQTEVMNQWFTRRNEKDLVIKMNTGSGKTVVGLLILKSCLNEGKGPAVYVTPDPYLVRQVVREAEDLGISVTTDATSLNFLRGKSILVINVYKLINGRSVFGVLGEDRQIKIGSFIIDDVHACLDTAESQFTLDLKSDTEAYKKMFNLFRQELSKQSEEKVLDIEAGDRNANMLVPYWIWNDKLREATRILHEVRDDDSVKFTWPLIKNSLSLCNCVIGADYLEISPKCLPINSIPSFVNADRRIFMSATLSDDSILVSHFNVEEEAICNCITPTNSDDIGDRMILVPQELNPDISDNRIKSYLKEISNKHNVVVIVPSNYRANFWSDVANETLTASNIYEGVNRLKSGHVGLVVFINKYDGIDLPKSACRILAIDGLPDVRRKIDKIEQGILFGSDEIQSQIIQRIEQGMGRGIRSRDDYCVVLLMGRTLTDNLYVQGVIDKFTPATKAQLQLSEKLSEQLRNKELKDIMAVTEYCLGRETDWVKASRGILVHIKYDSIGKIKQNAIKLRKAFNAALIRDYHSAVALINEAVNNETRQIVRGWLKQQLAEYYYLINPVESQAILKSAISDNNQVIKPLEGIEYSKLNKFTTSQAQKCSDFLNTFDDPNKIILKINSLSDQMIFRPETAMVFEQAIKEVARFIGFNSQRPEKEFGKGPDVLWEVGQLQYFVIECKNGATSDFINKHDCNQLNGSINWFKEKYDNSCSMIPIMIHPVNIFEYASSPDVSIRIMTKEKLDEFKMAIASFARAVVSANNYRNVRHVAELLVNFNLNPENFVNKFTTIYRVRK